MNASTDVANESYGWCTSTSPLAQRRRRGRARSPSPTASRGWVTGVPRLVLQVGPVEVVERPEPAEVERRRRPRRRRPRLELELADQQVPDLVGIAGVDLEPHRPAEPPAPAELDLDGGQEVVGLLLLERRGRRCG